MSAFLYDRAISTYFDLQGGLRSDLDSRRTRHWAALGIDGLAPLFFDVEATIYASDQGHLASRLQASYDLRITQRLVLQPEIEVNLYSKPDPARRVGAGFSDIDTGLRLRYELSRKFAPYIGVVYEGKFGQTANFARQDSASAGNVRFVFGIRTWFWRVIRLNGHRASAGMTGPEYAALVNDATKSGMPGMRHHGGEAAPAMAMPGPTDYHGAGPQR